MDVMFTNDTFQFITLPYRNSTRNCKHNFFFRFTTVRKLFTVVVVGGNQRKNSHYRQEEEGKSVSVFFTVCLHLEKFHFHSKIQRLIQLEIKFSDKTFL